MLTAEGETHNGANWSFTIGDLTHVPLDVLHGTLRTARLIVADVELEIARRARTATAAVPEPEQAIRIEEACPMMGLKYDYAIRRWRKLGGFKGPDGRIKFPLTVVHQRANGRAS